MTIEVPQMLSKDDVALIILAAKNKAGLSWEEIADKISMSPVWTHSACVGMNAMPKEKAQALVQVLGLPQDVIEVLVESPTKV